MYFTTEVNVFFKTALLDVRFNMFPHNLEHVILFREYPNSKMGHETDIPLFELTQSQSDRISPKKVSLKHGLGRSKTIKPSLR